MTIRYARPEYNGTIVYLIAVDAVDYAKATRERVPTRPAGPGEVPRLARDQQRPGQREFRPPARRQGRRHDRAARAQRPCGSCVSIGTVRDYSWSRGTIFMDRKRYAELFGDDLIDMCHVFLKSRPDGSAVADSRPRCVRRAKGPLRHRQGFALRKFLSRTHQPRLPAGVPAADRDRRGGGARRGDGTTHLGAAAEAGTRAVAGRRGDAGAGAALACWPRRCSWE